MKIDAEFQENNKVIEADFGVVYYAEGGNIDDYDEVFKAGQLNVLNSSEVLKGNKIGREITIDDISPIEHELKIKLVSEKVVENGLDISKISNQTMNGNTLTNNNDGTLTITMGGDIPVISLKETLQELCPTAQDNGYTTIYFEVEEPEYKGNAITLQCGPVSAYEGEEVTSTLPNSEYFSFISPTFNLLGSYTKPITIKNLKICIKSTDLSKVKVTRYGKNLLDKNNANIIVGYPSAENVISPASTTKSVYIPCAPNTTYTVSKVVTARFAVAFTDVLPASKVAVTGRVQNNTATSITSASSANSRYIVVWIYHSSYDTSITVDEVLATLQIEQGSTATEYEPYIEPQTATANADGTVIGIDYLYPSLRLTTDTDGVKIECQYYKDIDKTFNELEAQIVTLGGELA